MSILTVPAILGPLHVQDAGPADGPAALLWPSLFSDGQTSWGPQLAGLHALGWRTLLAGLPGTGGSDPASRLFTMQECASPLASTLITGDRDAVLVDPPFTRERTQQAGDWAERSGRQLACIYATHGHGGHRFGTGEPLERLPGAIPYATEGTTGIMHRNVAGRAQSRDPDFPGPIPGTPLACRPIPRTGSSWRVTGSPRSRPATPTPTTPPCGTSPRSA